MHRDPIEMAILSNMKLALISRAKERSVEGNGSRQLGDVVTIDGVIACQFRQRQVVWIERAQSKALKSSAG